MVNLNKQQTVNLLRMLEKQYGDAKLSSIRQKIQDDLKITGLSIFQRLLWGTKARFMKKGENALARYTVLSDWQNLE